MPEQHRKVLENVYLLGKPTRTIVMEADLLALSAHELDQTYKYLRITFHGIQIQSCEWKVNIQKHNNSAVAYRPVCGGIEYGLVQGFYVVEEGSFPKVYVTLTKLITNANSSSLANSTYYCVCTTHSIFIDNCYSFRTHTKSMCIHFL